MTPKTKQWIMAAIAVAFIVLLLLVDHWAPIR